MKNYVGYDKLLFHERYILTPEKGFLVTCGNLQSWPGPGGEQTFLVLPEIELYNFLA